MSVHDRMIDQVRTELLGASKEGIKQAIFRAYREWFDLSNSWQEQVDFTIVPNVQTYLLTSAEIPSGQPLRLLGVYDNNLIPWPAAMPNMNLANLPSPANTAPPTPAGTAPVLGTIYLYTMPSTTQLAYASIVKTCQLPGETAIGGGPGGATGDDDDEDDYADLPLVPLWFVNQWEEKIFEGVVGRLMNQPDKPYSNPKQADYHLRRFQMEAANARVAALRANTYGRQAWTYPSQWRSNSQRGGVSTGNDNVF
jgi:hypothetical protein